jgi:hypothetical protein
MLTCTEEIYRGGFGFRVFGTDVSPRQASEFVVATCRNQRSLDKLTAVLRAIDTAPLTYSHPEKFKRLEAGVWEIEIGRIRIACIWDPRPLNLIAVYGFQKKSDRWPERHLLNMRRQRDLYLSTRRHTIGGGFYASVGGPEEQD